jgi:LPS sulfotransferase NodH
MLDFTVDDKVLGAARALDATRLVANHKDNERPVAARNLLVVLSTPRSGSNYFCDVIEKEGLCRLTEYFHPTIHMPILADRWGCVTSGKLNFVRYGQALRDRIANEAGWVGTKLLDEHVEFFLASMPAFKDMAIHWVYLIRRDHIAQAISHYIAFVSGRWISNDPGTDSNVVYNYQKIRWSLNAITRGNIIIRAFLTRERISPTIVYYEDVMNDVEGQLNRIPGFVDRPLRAMRSSFERQATGRNAEWAERFARDFLAETFRRHAVATSNPKLNRLRRRIASMIGV